MLLHRPPRDLARTSREASPREAISEIGTCPRLWTTIYPTRPEVVQTSLTRSRNLPLNICFTDGALEEEILRSYRLVLSQMIHVRYASLEITPQIYGILSSNESARAASVMEELKIQWSSEQTKASAFRMIPMPRLHSLKLSRGTLVVLTSIVRRSITCSTLAAYCVHSMEFMNVFASLSV
ncbi:hypothetical protein NM688_g267 [Phlebia brevispora]|uniref:Uncharacterized protein n=1 Tax=Phlebia brevispora TaxID=194682 RepID=A0ACC1TF50_9APHY|nr:hypothetical protein NM688_g267 [Phlebia brevispora]